jgi:hypothetical protein
MERPMTVSNILYTLVVGLVDFEALGYSLPSIWVNPALYYLTTEVEIDFRKCQGGLTCTTMLPTWLVGTFFTTACRRNH